MPAPGVTGATVEVPKVLRQRPAELSDVGLPADAKEIPSTGTFLEVERPSKPKQTFWSYLLLCLLCTLPVSVTSIAFWSEIGLGRRSYAVLVQNYAWRHVFFAASAVLLLGLYLLDFFWPPQIPGQFLVLSKNDRYVGRSTLAVAVLFSMIGGMLFVKENPNLPLIISGFVNAGLVGCVRQATHWKQLVDQADDIVRRGNYRSKLLLMNAICWKEEDTMRYYKAAVTAFALTGAGCLLLFLEFVIHNGRPSDVLWEELDVEVTEHAQFTLWSAPLAVGLTNIAFGLFALFRVCVQPTYALTDMIKLALMAEHISPRAVGSLELNAADFSPTCSRAKSEGRQEEEDGAGDEHAKHTGRLRHSGSYDSYDRNYQELEKSREERMKQLSVTVKIIVCALLLLLGCFYVTVQLLYLDSHIATTALMGLSCFFLGFVIFSQATLRRIARAMGSQLVDMPGWKLVQSAANSDWMRAILFLAFLFICPVVLPLSATNQCVRRCRRKTASNRASDGVVDSPCSVNSSVVPRILHKRREIFSEGVLSWFTPRVSNLLAGMKEWNWVSVFSKCYILCFVVLCLKICPLLLNVVLAWMTVELAKMPFWAILVAIFIVGTIAFLLPPVPGMTVYMFGGLVISNPDACPYGFWGGTLINIVVMWLLKLFACAVQQKCIGEMLGKSIWVRHQAGIHKVSIRCIEAVMRKPGLSADKVAILCGGPDWPVSVLAGLLRLPLMQCEIGTIPVIAFVAPCALSGSFYLKWNLDGHEFWRRCANLMILTALAISALLWVIAGQGMQKQLEEHHATLNRPLPQNIDLEWLDYRAQRLAKACAVDWERNPVVLRTLYGGGAIVQILLCGAFTFLSAHVVGDFQVYHGIEHMRWVYDGGGEGDIHGVFTTWAIAGLCAFAIASLCPLPLKLWRSQSTREARLQAERDLEEEEAGWKESRLQELLAWKASESAERPSSTAYHTSAPASAERHSSTADDESPSRSLDEASSPDLEGQEQEAAEERGEEVKPDDGRKELDDCENWSLPSDKSREALPIHTMQEASPRRKSGQSWHLSQDNSSRRSSHHHEPELPPGLLEQFSPFPIKVDPWEDSVHVPVPGTFVYSKGSMIFYL